MDIYIYIFFLNIFLVPNKTSLPAKLLGKSCLMKVNVFLVNRNFMNIENFFLNSIIMERKLRNCLHFYCCNMWIISLCFASNRQCVLYQYVIIARLHFKMDMHRSVCLGCLHVLNLCSYSSHL